MKQLDDFFSTNVFRRRGRSAKTCFIRFETREVGFKLELHVYKLMYHNLNVKRDLVSLEVFL